MILLYLTAGFFSLFALFNALFKFCLNKSVLVDCSNLGDYSNDLPESFSRFMDYEDMDERLQQAVRRRFLVYWGVPAIIFWPIWLLSLICKSVAENLWKLAHKGFNLIKLIIKDLDV